MRFSLDADSPVAPYQQICDQVVAGVRSGALATGIRLPTVRGLAAELGLAVNTVAKAYKQLEAEGHVETRGRAGTVVLPGARARRGDGPGTDGVVPSDAIEKAAAGFAVQARRAGLDLDEAIGVLRRLW